jgi:tetratricopeptide (TPR) repeat protein
MSSRTLLGPQIFQTLTVSSEKPYFWAAEIFQRDELTSSSRVCFDWRDNETLWRKTIEVSTGSARAYNSVRNSYYVQGSYAETLEEFNKALVVAPGFSDAIMNAGLGCKHLGRIEEVRILYQKAIETDSDNPLRYYNLGLLYKGLGQFDKALAECNVSVLKKGTDEERPY